MSKNILWHQFRARPRKNTPPFPTAQCVEYLASELSITDEGGVTCHAAIISRELKIPCVIGTKIATKVLKDGDLVEVDAERGIVKVLKRS